MENETKYVDFYEYEDALRELNKKVYLMSEAGSKCWSSLGAICNINSNVPGSNERIELGINWCSCGTVELERAEMFAEEMKKVSELAKNFKYNGYKIILNK